MSLEQRLPTEEEWQSFASHLRFGLYKGRKVEFIRFNHNVHMNVFERDRCIARHTVEEAMEFLRALPGWNWYTRNRRITRGLTGSLPGDERSWS